MTHHGIKNETTTSTYPNNTNIVVVGIEVQSGAYDRGPYASIFVHSDTTIGLNDTNKASPISPQFIALDKLLAIA